MRLCVASLQQIGRISETPFTVANFRLRRLLIMKLNRVHYAMKFLGRI